MAANPENPSPEVCPSAGRPVVIDEMARMTPGQLAFLQDPRPRTLAMNPGRRAGLRWALGHLATTLAAPLPTVSTAPTQPPAPAPPRLWVSDRELRASGMTRQQVRAYRRRLDTIAEQQAKRRRPRR